MNTASSPGRTWIIFAFKRGMPDLAPASPAPVLQCGRVVARLSGVGGSAPATFSAYLGNQNHTRRKRGVEQLDDRWLGVPLDSLPLKRRLHGANSR